MAPPLSPSIRFQGGTQSSNSSVVSTTSTSSKLSKLGARLKSKSKRSFKKLGNPFSKKKNHDKQEKHVKIGEDAIRWALESSSYHPPPPPTDAPPVLHSGQGSDCGSILSDLEDDDDDSDVFASGSSIYSDASSIHYCKLLTDCGQLQPQKQKKQSHGLYGHNLYETRFEDDGDDKNVRYEESNEERGRRLGRELMRNAAVANEGKGKGRLGTRAPSLFSKSIEKEEETMSKSPLRRVRSLLKGKDFQPKGEVEDPKSLLKSLQDGKKGDDIIRMSVSNETASTAASSYTDDDETASKCEDDDGNESFATAPSSQIIRTNIDCVGEKRIILTPEGLKPRKDASEVADAIFLYPLPRIGADNQTDSSSEIQKANELTKSRSRLVADKALSCLRNRGQKKSTQSSSTTLQRHPIEIIFGICIPDYEGDVLCAVNRFKEEILDIWG